ncbi:hypothetical protein AN390_02132 [Pseudoalteromonas sp. P1-11]|nr:hypothetical protein AN390_02132 [Pseudoalteromonas sp. P1-11]
MEVKHSHFPISLSKMYPYDRDLEKIGRCFVNQRAMAHSDIKQIEFDYKLNIIGI